MLALGGNQMFVFYEKNYVLAIFFFLGGGSDTIDLFKIWDKMSLINIRSH